MQLTRLAFVLSMVTVAPACGGKPAGGTTPAPSIDPCAAGLHASGVTARAATWEVVGELITPSDLLVEVCQTRPCGADEPVSFVGGAPDDAIAIKHAAGWTVIGDVWDSDEHQPDATVTAIGDARWLHLYFEETGRDEVELDDGTVTTATVTTSQRYEDFVIDAQGKVLFRAHCASGEEDSADRPTAITRDGDTFAYVRCTGDATPVRFTAAQAAACPSYVDGPR